MTRIKFCGMTRPVDAATAARYGASFIGAVFADGPRRVDPSLAAEIFDAAPGLKRVGVFRHATVEKMLRHSELAGLDVVQLHARFDAAALNHFRERFDGEIWTVAAIDARAPELPEDVSELMDIADVLVLDTSVRGTSGGTGVAFDWNAIAPAIRGIAGRVTISLAGGLNSQNVAKAIEILRPEIVDVSSGVESAPGIKDPNLMKSFAEAVRAASIV